MESSPNRVNAPGPLAVFGLWRVCSPVAYVFSRQWPTSTLVLRYVEGPETTRITCTVSMGTRKYVVSGLNFTGGSPPDRTDIVRKEPQIKASGKRGHVDSSQHACCKKKHVNIIQKCMLHN